MTSALNHPRILVYGAGAVGTLLGGCLSEVRGEVTLLGRGPSIEEIAKGGLRVETPSRSFRTSPAAISDLEQLTGQFDVVLLTLRAFAVEQALESVKALLATDGVLITLQNGIGTEELVQNRLPDVHHIAASLTLSADIPEPGAISTSSRSGGIALAPVSPGAPIESIASTFRQTGIPTATLDSYRSMKWSKLLLNQMANGIAAILDWKPGQVYRHPDVFRIEQAMLRETMLVISAENERLVSLPGFPVPLLGWVLRMPPGVARRLLLRQVEGGRGDKLPSLLLDLQAGRRELEADWLYGAVAERGDALGTTAPVNRRINTLLKGIAANPELWETFRDQPGRLIRTVRLAVEGSSET